MIRWFADLPIERKLRVVIMVPATVAFGIALAMHIATNLLHLREDMLRRASRVARARSLGLATCAEGVETEAQWHYLRKREANQVQGFLFCRPLPIPELERWHTDWLHSDQLRAASVA